MILGITLGVPGVPWEAISSAWYYFSLPFHGGRSRKDVYLCSDPSRRSWIRSSAGLE